MHGPFGDIPVLVLRMPFLYFYCIALAVMLHGPRLSMILFHSVTQGTWSEPCFIGAGTLFWVGVLWLHTHDLARCT